MNNTLKNAKKTMKNQTRPYQTYIYCLGIPIFNIFLYILAVFNIRPQGTGLLILVFTILVNTYVAKLDKVSSKKYIAPILIYISEIISIFIILSLIRQQSANFVVFTMVTLILRIAALIFFFITANDIKKAYPTMKEDSEKAGQEYVSTKNNHT